MLRKMLLPLVLLAAVVAGAAGARAETVRVPLTGPASFTLEVPAGWTATYAENGTLRLAADDKSAQVQLSIIGVDAGTTAAALAEGIKPPAVGTTPYAKPVPAKIAGLAGQEFSLRLGDEATLSLVLVKMDATSYAAQTTLRRTGITPVQLALLKALLALVKVAKGE